jgi:long-chain acyl-CoA synthetase
MPGVQDCAVFGIPHDEFGEALAAAVQPRAGVTLHADAVQQYVRERLAGYKVPGDRHLSPTRLPREDTGKYLQAQAARAVLGRTFAAACSRAPPA